MSYNKLGFTSGQTLKAEHLNHMEEGIANVSWNDLTDKPFYDETPAPIVWDGNKEGYEVAEALNPSGDTLFLVKVSDCVFTAADLIGATFSGVMNGSAYSSVVAEGQFIVNNEDTIVWGDLNLISTSVTTFSVGFDITVPSPGTYITTAPDLGMNVESARCDFPSKVKPLDAKYTCEIIKLTADDTTVNGDKAISTRNYDDLYESLRAGRMVWIDSLDLFNNDSYQNTAGVGIRDMIISWGLHSTMGLICYILHATSGSMIGINFTNGSYHT